MPMSSIAGKNARMSLEDNCLPFIAGRLADDLRWLGRIVRGDDTYLAYLRQSQMVPHHAARCPQKHRILGYGSLWRTF